jgi:hypothetical protein
VFKSDELDQYLEADLPVTIVKEFASVKCLAWKISSIPVKSSGTNRRLVIVGLYQMIGDRDYHPIR